MNTKLMNFKKSLV